MPILELRTSRDSLNKALQYSIHREQKDVGTVKGKSSRSLCCTVLVTVQQVKQDVCVAGTKSCCK